MSQFSTNETAILEKRVNIPSDAQKTDSEDIDYEYEIDKCAKWIVDNNYEKVCLQFPDHLLPDSAEVTRRIENILQNKVYILGDTAYESCCIDFTSAQHISADAIIHFGPTCFSKPEKIIPYLKIYTKLKIDVEMFCNNVQQRCFENDVTIILDTPYLHKIDEIKNSFDTDNVTIDSILNVSPEIINMVVIYLGENDRKLLNLSLTLHSSTLYFCNPKISYDLDKYKVDTRILKRRHFLREKIKDSNTIGIVIGTLAVKNYLKVLERVKTLAKLHSKKYYTISVGKPTVAKLANFPEVDVFVVIGCAMNEIYENREYYKPIVTPFDIEASLNPRYNSVVDFSYDFNTFLTDISDIHTISKDEVASSDVSLLSGNIRCNETKEESIDVISGETSDKQIALKDDGKLVVSSNYGAGYLSNRSWKGLEQNLGGNVPKKAERGRKGIAQGYENEN